MRMICVESEWIPTLQEQQGLYIAEAGGTGMDRIIKVTGKGKLTLKPDTIRLRIELSDTDKEYDNVIRKSTEHSEEVREAFTGLGFESTDLKTLRFQVDTQYEQYQDKRDNSWKRRFTGYKAAHVLKIEFSREKGILGKVLYMIARLPARPEFHVEYTVKDTEGAKNALLAKAVADSAVKAQVLTEAAGVRLGNIMTIDYSWGEVDFVSRPMSRMADMEFMAAGASLAEDSYDYDIEPDDIDVEDTVTLVWELIN